MAEEEESDNMAAGGGGQKLEGGTYEVIRARLDTRAATLRQQLAKLNADRQEVFGAIEPKLVSTERITTANNCTARDMVSVGAGKFLFGYNVQLGLKSTTDIGDVLALYRYQRDDHSFHEMQIDGDTIEGFADFEGDFQYLYRYYNKTVFVKFMVIGPSLFMAFRVGKDVRDIKTFKFLIDGEGGLTYLGNRNDHEYVFPNQQEFEWRRAHRDMHRGGLHPHISIADRVFVETVGGDLTIKVEDNTESGEGIYAEPVDDPDQTLDDAEVFYAIVGSLILLRIRPYQEKTFRCLVFAEKVNQVRRIDSIEHSCVLLPDDHGIIFSDGYFLQSGECKIFDSGLREMMFERRIAASNGEDYLYVFYNRLSGDYVLMSYNLIEQKVDTPIICNGLSVFRDGELVYFKAEEIPQKHHTLQVWQTPYSAEATAPVEKQDSYLFKIGNAEVVRCMAECHEVLNLLGKDDSYADLYIDLVKKTGDISDTYFWVGDEAAHNLRAPLMEINAAASSAIAEFDKVVRLRKAAEDETRAAEAKAKEVINRVTYAANDDIMGFVHNLADLRTLRGEVVALRGLRYVDLQRIDKLEQSIIESSGSCSKKCVAFLLEPGALDPYRNRVAEQRVEAEKVEKVAEANSVENELGKTGSELEMLVEVVSNLKIDDATQTTQIIDDISAVYGTLNQVKAELKRRKNDLGRNEGAAEFGAQIKLLNQAVVNYLEQAETPERCDELLTRTMVQLEELDGKFGDFEEFVEEISKKREELYDAFESRKLALLEKRNRRAGALVKSAERILNSVSHRLEGLSEISEIHGYFASDLMVEKVREVIGELRELGDSVKADDIQTRLKTVREDAIRQLRDRKELYIDGENVLQFGEHKFSVNTQELELTIVPRDEGMALHLTGTNFFQQILDPEFLATREVWDQAVVSENRSVYRAEYLAYLMAESGEGAELMALPEEELKATVQKFMAPRYFESYTKGVHDFDAATILKALLECQSGAGMLRFGGETRACGIVFWLLFSGGEEGGGMAAKLRSLGRVRAAFGARSGGNRYQQEIEERVGAFVASQPVFEKVSARAVAEYLFEEVVEGEGFTVSGEAAELLEKFQRNLGEKGMEQEFSEACERMDADLCGRYQICLDWLHGYVGSEGRFFDREGLAGEGHLEEAAAHLLRGGGSPGEIRRATLSLELNGMLGAHPLTESGKYQFDLNGYLARLDVFVRESVPRFEAYVDLKKKLVDDGRDELRLDDFKPKVLSSFVRNRLLDKVYLPLVGDNLAKQIGVAGADTRTDRMGMLLLISPPGYGKTTLMEYIANRLGLAFMKINGPALGHSVTSLDPADAPNAGARQEVDKLNLALEMGDNVMIYVDDIQHCNPEFLQKFISLCDAQRRIEGVWKGEPRTYDLRGKKVAVVMAGNPYTESGGKFQIPDMLANRADTYNLGDIIGGNKGDFKMSYLENALTSNTTLARLSGQGSADVRAMIQIAGGGSREGIDFEGNYSPEELAEMEDVMRKLMRVRDTVLRVNQEYIRSAAQSDEYRTEPPFKLQGSYRNMNRMAEKILPIMTDEEVEAVIFDHYENEAQTLTTGAEANLLKFKELEGVLAGGEADRWEEIRKTFRRNLLTGGAGDNDPVSRVVGQLSGFNVGLERIGEALGNALAEREQGATLADATVEKLEKIIAGLRAVPVDVEIKVVPVQEEAPGRAAKKKAPSKKASRKTAAKKKASPDKASEIQELPVDVKSKVQQGD